MRNWKLLIVLGLLAAQVQAQEVVLRHALEGRAQDALATLVLRFNEAQHGKAKVLLQNVGGVGDSRQLPEMALLHPDDAMSFFGTLPRYLPLAKVMAEAGEKLDAKRFYPQVADAVDDAGGKLQALPLGLSYPVLFWNKDLFRKAGLDPEKPPRTWWEVQDAAGVLVDHDSACPFTTSRFAWIQVENVAAQHNENMMLARPSRVTLNSLVNVKHLALLASWHKSLYFRYYGPLGEGDGHFLAGECGMLTGESSLYAELASRGRPDFGVAALPYYDDVYGVSPPNVLPDGAGLYVLAGFKKPEYKVVARFAAFMAAPAQQKEWVKATGYLPMTPEALDALRDSGLPAPLLDAAAKRLAVSKAQRVKSGGLLGRLREILSEEVAAVWRNEKPAKAALDTAMQRVNGNPK